MNIHLSVVEVTGVTEGLDCDVTRKPSEFRKKILWQFPFKTLAQVSINRKTGYLDAVCFPARKQRQFSYL